MSSTKMCSISTLKMLMISSIRGLSQLRTMWSGELQQEQFRGILVWLAFL
jgi:hypothetical protein